MGYFKNKYSDNIIDDIEAYFINHPYDLIRVSCGMMNDEIKTGVEWLKEYRAGKITEEWNYLAFEDDEADYYDIRIEMM